MVPAPRAERRPRMGWSWRVGSVAGIDLYLHATFAMLLLWVLFARVGAGQGLGAGLRAVASVLALFLCVVLHELGHALVARRFGVRTRDITLLPIGGVARLDRIPEKPREELLVAIAGPLVNGLIALFLFALPVARAALPSVPGIDDLLAGPWTWTLAWTNVSLAAFNLLPAFPMDGGRVLRALLAMRMDRVRATEVAAHLGQLLALLFAGLGLFFSPALLFVAFFVWIGAQSESVRVQIDATLAELPARTAAIRQFDVLWSEDELSFAAERTLSGFQGEFPVARDGAIVGTVSQSQILRALNERGPDAHVAEVMRPDVLTVDAADSLDRVFDAMADGDFTLALVMDRERLRGLLTRDALLELVAIRDAMRKSEPPPALRA